MNFVDIQERLKQALLEGGEMSSELYAYELEGEINSLKKSMKRDKDDYTFAVTVSNDHVAMILIEKSGKIYSNEEARERLKVLWPVGYEPNMKQFIPNFAQQLMVGELPYFGVKVAKKAPKTNTPRSKRGFG